METENLFVNLLVEYIVFLNNKNTKIAVIDLPINLRKDFNNKLNKFGIETRLYFIENENIPNSLNSRIKELNLPVELGKTICTW